MEDLDKPFKGTGTLTKAELRDIYNISATTLANLLNVKYFAQLQPLGYIKDSKILSPVVLKKFMEIYGEPL